jgi:uncharacterized protein YjbJ (UPF0337 family)
MSAKGDQAKGRIKEAMGALTDDEKLVNEGKKDQLAGDAKELVNDLAGKVEEVVDDVKKAVTED